MRRMPRRDVAGKQRRVSLREGRVEEREHGELPGGPLPVFRPQKAQPQVEVRPHVRREDAGRLPERLRRFHRPEHPEQGHPEAVVRPRIPRPGLRRPAERLGRLLVLSLPKEEDAQGEEGGSVFRIAACRLPEGPGRPLLATEGEKDDPEIEVGACVDRFPPDDFTERRRRFLVPSGPKRATPRLYDAFAYPGRRRSVSRSASAAAPCRCRRKRQTPRL